MGVRRAVGCVHAHSARGASSVAPFGRLQPCCLHQRMLPGGSQRPGWEPSGHKAWDGDTDTSLASGQAWAGPLETGGGGQGCLPPGPGRGEECTLLGEGLQAPLRRGRGCCTKPACVSPEWAALSQALAHRPRTSLSGEAGGVATATGFRPTSWPLPAQAPHPPGGEGNESL